MAGFIGGRGGGADQVVNGTSPYDRRERLLIRRRDARGRRSTVRILHRLTTRVQMSRNAIPRLHRHSGLGFHHLDIAVHEIGVGQIQNLVYFISGLVYRLAVVIEHEAAVRAVIVFDYGVTWGGDLRGRHVIGSSLLTLLLVGGDRAHLATLLVLLLAADFATHLDILNVAILFAEGMFEVLERQHDHGDVVERLVGDRRLHDLLHHVPANLVDLLVFGMEVLFGSYPRLLDHLRVADLVEYAVATKEQKIHFVVDGELFDVGNSYHDVGVAAKLLALRLDISECS